MAQDHSFDIVSKVDIQEVRNAVQMSLKEIVQRYDFKGTSAGITLEEKPLQLILTADHSMQMENVRDLVFTKMAKRGVSMKVFKSDPEEPAPGGKLRQKVTIQQGISHEQAKAITQVIRALGLKVQPRIEGDKVKVAARQIDDLQTVIGSLKDKDFGTAIQVENYR